MKNTTILKSMIFYFSLVICIYVFIEGFCFPPEKTEAESIKLCFANTIASRDTTSFFGEINIQFFSSIFPSSAFAQEISEKDTKGSANQSKQESEQCFTQNNYLQIFIGYLLGMLFVAVLVITYCCFPSIYFIYTQHLIYLLVFSEICLNCTPFKTE